MDFTSADSRVIYASDPAPDAFARTEANAMVQPAPACWVAFQRAVPPPVSLVPGASQFFDSGFYPLAPAAVYMHWRSTGGRKRLVVAQFGEQGLNGKVHRVICCRVFEPATLRRDPVILWEGSTIVASSFEWTATVRVFAAQTDVADPSHFSIAVEVDRSVKVLDGWLQADDTVKTTFGENSAGNANDREIHH
jgi:hypothetical protein